MDSPIPFLHIHLPIEMQLHELNVNPRQLPALLHACPGPLAVTTRVCCILLLSIIIIVKKWCSMHWMQMRRNAFLVLFLFAFRFFLGNVSFAMCVCVRTEELIQFTAYQLCAACVANLIFNCSQIESICALSVLFAKPLFTHTLRYMQIQQQTRNRAEWLWKWTKTDLYRNIRPIDRVENKSAYPNHPPAPAIYGVHWNA